MTERIAFASSISLEGRRLRGSVKLAGERTRRNGEWLEVDPAAVVGADASDVIGRWEHDPSRVLGRTANGTVRLSRTEEGINYEIDVPNTSYGNDVLELVNRGDVRGSSFEIEGIRSTFSTDPDGTRVRRITHIDRLTDVSPVTDPAFTASTVAAFSKENQHMPAPEIIPAIEPPVPVAPATPATPEKSDTTRTAEAYARKLDLADLEAAMENLLAGDMNAAKSESYDAMSAVYDERKRDDAQAKDRFERMKLAQDMRLGRVPKAPMVNETFASEDYLRAFTKYLRTGDPDNLAQFAQSIAGDGTQGGYTVPDGFLNRIVERMVAYGGVASVADLLTTGDGQTLRWPTNDDTTNSASIVAEGAASTAGADKAFGSVDLGAYSYDATGAGNLPLLVSKELLQDSAFDIGAFIGRNLGDRLGRKMAGDFATGTGIGMPLGLFAKAADVMTATTMFAALIEHTFQVDSAYRQDGNCRWLLSDTTLAKIYGSVDKNGRPLFIPSADASGTGRPAGVLLGYPVTLDQGAGNLVAFGDMRRGYIVRRVRGVQIDVDPYTNIKTRQVAYHGWARADAAVQDSWAYSVSSYAAVTADAV